jgi:3-dehydroquinate synthase
MLPDQIRISDNPGSDLRDFLSKKKHSKVCLLVDENTQRFSLPVIKDSLPGHSLIQVKGGEENKTIPNCIGIWTGMTEHQLDRSAVLVVLGGGVLGDMGGFCASTFKRGIDFILIPTTLLAMADASIGGKLGVDFNHYKNHLGLFKEPVLNLIHPGFLETLPEKELKSGFAEIIKHALISDQKLWNEIRSRSLADQNWSNLINHSAEFKSSVVAKDPTEMGLRKILNAGHTVGHALETFFLAGGSKIMHGEAVAAGLIAESFLGLKAGMIDQSSLDQIANYILRVFGKLQIPRGQYSEIAKLCLQDKKNVENRILCTLPDGVGKAKWNCEVSLDEIVESLTFYSSLQI